MTQRQVTKVGKCKERRPHPAGAETSVGAKGQTGSLDSLKILLT
jgi:hypothetical protein